MTKKTTTATSGDEHERKKRDHTERKKARDSAHELRARAVGEKIGRAIAGDGGGKVVGEVSAAGGIAMDFVGSAAQGLNLNPGGGGTAGNSGENKGKFANRPRWLGGKGREQK